MTSTWVGTSWKMTKTLAEARAFARGLAAAEPALPAEVQPFVIPPATALAAVRAELPASSRVLVGAQDAHWEDAGPWTGEVSVPQVADAGARLVEIGHSERREAFGETDERIRLKVHATLRHSLVPLVCVGEPAAVRAAGGQAAYVAAQTRAAFDGVAAGTRVLVAYEPVWAIGEGGRPATPDDVEAPVAAIRAATADLDAHVLYGGSVDGENAPALLDVPGVGGLFVGRAAWDLAGFLTILRVAARG
ncbi:Triose-phosphate isomerase [Beutenbergia cavernae DSM 12333]|uniref:Triosephosphate isomerase n=1 Tax=Beutenbergia cavernae (strain ATCC BAA-8 / DSM 12333 / CCUG 43141 / JCM 11478 / NBRC 16432 / NCIMB 13614 / HKI 0122) TaxID=471853 RepID=C5C3A6_BEUC1|nr:triose-phosphate isomerase [Beutenbergia cavernae]ACQ79805.1 Triose-phosphate isomerase [Beutenbergia cavernae DSM 12333]